MRQRLLGWKEDRPPKLRRSPNRTMIAVETGHVKRGQNRNKKFSTTSFYAVFFFFFFSGSMLSLFFTCVSEQQKTKYLKHTANVVDKILEWNTSAPRPPLPPETALATTSYHVRSFSIILLEGNWNPRLFLCLRLVQLLRSWHAYCLRFVERLWEPCPEKINKRFHIKGIWGNYLLFILPSLL